MGIDLRPYFRKGKTAENIERVFFFHFTSTQGSGTN
jgi:hypothetical protein